MKNDKRFEILKKFGKNVKIERIRKDYTQEQLAEKMGVSQNYIASIEGGRANMSIVKLHQLAEFLQTDIKNFFY